MDTRIGHDPLNEALHARQTAQHVRGPFVFKSAARLQDVKFTHHDNKQVKSERMLGNLAQPKPFVSTVFEGGVERCFSRNACFTFHRQRGGPDYLYHVPR
jgi:hypothetical protein